MSFIIILLYANCLKDVIYCYLQTVETLSYLRLFFSIVIFVLFYLDIQLIYYLFIYFIIYWFIGNVIVRKQTGLSKVRVMSTHTNVANKLISFVRVFSLWK